MAPVGPKLHEARGVTTEAYCLHAAADSEADSRIIYHKQRKYKKRFIAIVGISRDLFFSKTWSKKNK